MGLTITTNLVFVVLDSKNTVTGYVGSIGPL